MISRSTARQVPLGVIMVLVVAFFGGIALQLPAQNLDVDEYVAMGVKSIPVPPVMDPETTYQVGMVRLKFRQPVGGGSNSISSLSVSLTRQSGTFDETSIAEIRVYRDPAGDRNAVWDATDPRYDAGGPHAFSGGSATISIDETYTFGSAGWQYLYVVFVVKDDADASDAIGCEITAVVHGTYSGGTFTPAASTYDPTPHGTYVPVDDYEVTLTATGIAPPTAEQSDERVPVLKLEFKLANAGETSAVAIIDTLTLRRVGGADTDFAPGGITLYDDSGSIAEEFDADDGFVASTNMSAGSAILGTNLQFGSAGATYYVAVNVRLEAAPGHEIGLEVENPSTRIVFVDRYADSNVGSPDYARTSIEYDQAGYIVSTAVTPSAGNTFEVLERVLPDTTPPTVNVTIPTAGGRLASINSPILIYWSEDVTGAGDDPGADKGDFVFADMGGDPVDFDVSYTVSGSQYITTITPVDPLAYETIYEITVLAAGIQDKATPPNGMGENYTFLFSTPPEFPPVSEPTAFNNRIVSGGNSQVVILIPQPPGGAAARMSVQVFTTTGKLVRTFYRDTAYATIEGDLPIRWDGTNEQGRALGPGMYFIQIRSGSYKRVLRVLIVR